MHGSTKLKHSVLYTLTGFCGAILWFLSGKTYETSNTKLRLRISNSRHLSSITLPPVWRWHDYPTLPEKLQRNKISTIPLCHPKCTPTLLCLHYSKYHTCLSELFHSHVHSTWPNCVRTPDTRLFYPRLDFGRDSRIILFMVASVSAKQNSVFKQARTTFFLILLWPVAHSKSQTRNFNGSRCLISC